jgi:hypothetical protein
METMLLTKLASVVLRDGGALVPRTFNFPDAWGLLPIQAFSGVVAEGFAGGACCSMKTMLGPRRTIL